MSMIGAAGCNATAKHHVLHNSVCVCVIGAAGYIAKHYGWQWGMWAPGAAALAVGLFALAAAR